MKTIRRTDYFAPLVVYPLYSDLLTTRQTFIPAFPPVSEKQVSSYPLLELDPADTFTYIIMGLAVLIAILIPLLNLN